MFFSLIVATVDRSAELERFLSSLESQTYRDFKLIVVDQNPDDRLLPILARYRGAFSITRVYSERGASRARNVGIKHATGAIVAFPDDDCQYPPNLLDTVAQLFRAHPEIDGLTGRSVDRRGNETVSRFDNARGSIDRFNVWARAVEFCMFIRRCSMEDVWFDEDLGVGASTIFWADEGIDLLLRLLDRGATILYDPEVVVLHPSPIPSYDERAITRAYKYGCGRGRVLRKHRYPMWFVGYLLLRSIGGILQSIALARFGKARYYWASLLGKGRGWLSK